MGFGCGVSPNPPSWTKEGPGPPPPACQRVLADHGTPPQKNRSKISFRHFDTKKMPQKLPQMTLLAILGGEFLFGSDFAPGQHSITRTVPLFKAV